MITFLDYKNVMSELKLFYTQFQSRPNFTSKLKSTLEQTVIIWSGPSQTAKRAAYYKYSPWEKEGLPFGEGIWNFMPFQFGTKPFNFEFTHETEPQKKAIIMKNKAESVWSGNL